MILRPSSSSALDFVRVTMADRFSPAGFLGIVLEGNSSGGTGLVRKA